MNDNKKRAIVDTLGHVNEEDRYYVYALCEKVNDKGIPFYIGKGQGERIWQHEIEADDLLETLKTEALDEVQQERTNKFKDKHKEIKRLIKEKRYERKIIKWGLTEKEAFMVESALINLIGFENLTNLVNGHASQKEKNSNIHTTKAMTTDEFYIHCKKAISLQDVKEKWLFININAFYPELGDKSNDPKLVCDVTRGFWKVAHEPKSEAEYIFSVYKSRIVGVFKCRERIKVSEITEEELVPENLAKDDSRLPKYPENKRKEDVKKIKDRENDIMNRCVFLCDTLDESHKIKGLEKEGITVGDLLNRLVLTKDNKSIFPRQGSIRYPEVRIYNKAGVNASRLEKELLKYFLKVEIKNCDENESLRRIDKKSITSKYTEKLREKDKVNIKEFFELLDYTVEKNEEPEILAKEIYNLVIQKSRKALSKCIKDNC